MRKMEEVSDRNGNPVKNDVLTSADMAPRSTINTSTLQHSGSSYSNPSRQMDRWTDLTPVNDDITEEEFQQIAMLMVQEEQEQNTSRQLSSKSQVADRKNYDDYDSTPPPEEEDDDEADLPEPDSPSVDDEDMLTFQDIIDKPIKLAYQVPHNPPLMSNMVKLAENITPIRIGTPTAYPNVFPYTPLEKTTGATLEEVPSVEALSNPLGIHLKSALDMAAVADDGLIDMTTLEQNQQPVKDQTSTPKIDRLHAIRMIRSKHHNSESDNLAPTMKPVKEENPPIDLPFVTKAFIYYAHLESMTPHNPDQCTFFFQWMGHTFNISGSIEIPMSQCQSSISICFLSKYSLTYEVDNNHQQQCLAYKIIAGSLNQTHLVSVLYDGLILQLLARLKFNPTTAEYLVTCDLTSLKLPVAKIDDKGKSAYVDVEENVKIDTNQKIIVFFNTSVLIELDREWVFQ